MFLNKSLNKIKEKRLFKKEAKIFSKVFVDQAVVSGGNFFTTYILLKFLGIRDFGIFSAIWIFIISINTFQEALIISPLLSISSKLKGISRREYISNMKIFQFIFSIISSFITILIIALTKNQLNIRNVDNLLLINIFFCICTTQFNEFCRKTIYLVSSIDNLFKLLILIISLSLGFKSEKAILFIHSLSAFACIIPSLKYIPNTKTNIKSLIYSFKRNWSISKWLFSNSILSWVQSNYILLLTNALLGPVSLGIIRVFQSILGVSHIFLHSIHSWLPSKTAKELSENRENFHKNIIQITIILWLILTLLFLCIVIFSNTILSFYDFSVAQYKNIFIVYVITYLIMSLNYPLKSILIGIEKTFSSFINIILSAGFILIFGNLMIKEFGLQGTIFMLTLSQIIILFTNLFFVRKSLYNLKRKD